MTELAGTLGSYSQATQALAMAADISVSTTNLQRAVVEVGQELADQTQAQARAFRRRKPGQCPADPPQVAVVEVDGGHIQTRQANCPRGVHEKAGKELKVAAVVATQSAIHNEDPQPDVPEKFLHSRRVVRLVQQLHRRAGPIPEEQDFHAAASEEPEKDQAQRPEGKFFDALRTCVATTSSSSEFGPMVAGEAFARGFFSSSRQAFVADGANYNWTIHRTWFSHFEPICDFLHVLCYVYTAAVGVGETSVELWQKYTSWVSACWQGRVEQVCGELQEWVCARRVEWDLPESGDASSLAVESRSREPPPQAESTSESPDGERRKRLESVLTCLGYLTNNASRMNYPRYRERGLPVTSSWVESLVGEFNARLKSRQKYWERGAKAEGLVQVRAALLSQDGRLKMFFAHRQGQPFRRTQRKPK
jgi:hypothetical protein